MKKLFSFLLLSLLFTKSFAQLDTEHWFAPMMDRTGNSSQNQTLYFSTNEITAFPITIYNNNIPIGTVTVIKGSPQKFNVNRNFIITTNQTDLFTTTTKGLYTKGDKPYFANLRFSVLNHAEILTSKGKAGIGTKFYAAMAPITVDSGILNFMTSIMATEDSTTIKVSGYQTTVAFSTPQGSSIDIKLNKGQSYIIDGRGNNSNNRTGFIGAKIVSDKSISVTNGNFNGQYAGSFSSSSDILMDQSVPVERLGNEFALVKGNGPVGRNMEGGIIVATENNTQVFINNIAAPIATLNEGQYYVIPDTSYSFRGGSVYNMFIKTTKNVYLYQLLAGASNGTLEATGGFNYIPPLSCYLPKTIDEIGLINENYTVSNGSPAGLLNISTKLNIITEVGGVIKVNGVSPTAASGPYALLGNPQWVTYSVEDVKGNITITSTKAVTAGIAAGDGAVGYGGYFAGFSTIPTIIKSGGNCIPGIILSTDADFDTFQWQLNGADISGANSSTYTPTTAGNYTVTVSKGSCSPVSTSAFKVLNCIKLTSIDQVACGSFNILPKLSASTQNLVISTVVITKLPSKGNVVIDSNTGTITYTPNAGSFGPDSFKYKFCGDGEFEDCEEVTVNLTIGQLNVTPATLKVCSSKGIGIFDLTAAMVTTDSPVWKKYYKSEEGAMNEDSADEITNAANYSSAAGIAYVLVEKLPEGCKKVAKITLELFPEIILNTASYNAINCDNDLDGKIDIDFSTITPVILQNSTYFDVKYYLDINDANAFNSNTLPNNWSYTTNTTVHVRVESPDGCPIGKASIDFKIGDKVSFNDPGNITVCDNDINGSEDILLSNYKSLFTSDADVSIRYFSTLAQAQASLSSAEISTNQNLTGDKIFYLRLTKAGFCDSIALLNIKFNTPKKSSTLPSTDIVCEGTTRSYSLENGFTSILWSDGTTSQTKELGVGTHFVDLGFNGCVYRQRITITEEKKAILNAANYTTFNCDDNFDGKIDIKFSDITPIILPDANGFDIKYYSDAAATILLANDYSYFAETTVYVRVTSQNCPPIIQPLLLRVGNTISLVKLQYPVIECDDDLDGIKIVDISKYISNFTNDSTVSQKYFASLSDARNNQSAISKVVSVNKTATYYLRFSQNGSCDNIAKLDITINVPTASLILQDKNICPDTLTNLDAGNGFTSYAWYNATNDQAIPGGQSITVGVGDYYVDLGSGNSCIYRQKVSVKAVELPTITAINIQGTTVTITANGGNAPYQYSLNGGPFQTSNIFNNVKSGKNNVSVISADNCLAILKEFSLIKITNVITPNDDNMNDTFSYSDLRTKDNPKFEIYDRYGKLIFKGSENNNYTWDGTSNNRKLPETSYWYVLEWQEFGTGVNVKYSGWVVLKNSNF